jgi:hypothetical protein
MQTPLQGDRPFLVLHPRGAQTTLDIMAIAGELAHSERCDRARLVLFDWSGIDCWPFKAPSTAEILAWHKTTPLIARAAFVHHQRLYRHAALLAALLRVRDTEASSFRPCDYDKAIAWLAKPVNNQRSSPE